MLVLRKEIGREERKNGIPSRPSLPLVPLLPFQLLQSYARSKNSTSEERIKGGGRREKKREEERIRENKEIQFHELFEGRPVAHEVFEVSLASNLTFSQEYTRLVSDYGIPAHQSLKTK